MLRLFPILKSFVIYLLYYSAILRAYCDLICLITVSCNFRIQIQDLLKSSPPELYSFRITTSKHYVDVNFKPRASQFKMFVVSSVKGLSWHWFSVMGSRCHRWVPTIYGQNAAENFWAPSPTNGVNGIILVLFKSSLL